MPQCKSQLVGKYWLHHKNIKEQISIHFYRVTLRTFMLLIKQRLLEDAWQFTAEYLGIFQNDFETIFHRKNILLYYRNEQ